MSRKPKLPQKPTKHESTNLSIEEKEAKPESKKSSLTALDKLEPQESSISKMCSRKRVKKTPSEVRRSGRRQNAIKPTESQRIERIIEEITLSGSEKEDEPADKEVPEPTLNAKDLHGKVDHLGQFVPTESQCIERIIEEITLSGSEKEDKPADKEVPEPTLNGKDLNGKVDHLGQLVEAQQKAMDKLNSRVIGKTSFGESLDIVNVTYKSLYIDSVKKIEALKEENSRLRKDLEFARGKIEVYEKGNHVTYETLDKVKDVFFHYSCLTKATEAMVNASSRTTPGNFNALETDPEIRTSKRKRAGKESDKN